MPDHIINDFIVVNCTSPDIDPNSNCIHFLTSIGRHLKSIKDVISDHVLKVYTSEFNVWYLTTFFHVDSSRFIAVPLHRKKEIIHGGKKLTFEFLDANHCAGSVMILLKGDFGSYLYTGNCRYTPQMLEYKSLRPFCKGNKELDRLYINGAFKKLGYNFPSKDVVTKQIIDFIRSHRKETVYLCCRQLGKEDLLVSISKQLNETICITKEKMKIMKKLGYSESLFTLEPSKSRIRVLPPSEVTWLKMKKRRETERCVAIVMTGCLNGKNDERGRLHGIYKFAASDHSSANEMQEMIAKISARCVLFLNHSDSKKSSKISAELSKPNSSEDSSISVRFDIVTPQALDTSPHFSNFDQLDQIEIVPPPPLSEEVLPEMLDIVPPPPGASTSLKVDHISESNYTKETSASNAVSNNDLEDGNTNVLKSTVTSNLKGACINQQTSENIAVESNFTESLSLPELQDVSDPLELSPEPFKRRYAGRQFHSLPKFPLNKNPSISDDTNYNSLSTIFEESTVHSSFTKSRHTVSSSFSKTKDSPEIVHKSNTSATPDKSLLRKKSSRKKNPVNLKLYEFFKSSCVHIGS